MTDLRCALGLHDFRWPPHHRYGSPYGLWQDFDVECARPGCTARKVARCYPDWHYEEHHPEPLEGSHS